MEDWMRLVGLMLYYTSSPVPTLTMPVVYQSMINSTIDFAIVTGTEYVLNKTFHMYVWCNNTSLSLHLAVYDVQFGTLCAAAI